MPDCCICYTTDPTYLFPTFVSASQARRQTSVDKADVVIFSFGATSAAQDAFGRVCQAEGVRFITVDRDAIDGAPVMLARLFLTRFAPAEYRHFLYIDGDTRVTGSLDPLVDFPVPDDKFMAANDPMTFALPGTDSHSRGIADHFSSLGLSEGGTYNYFNTGVLRINRACWEEIGLGAWRLFSQNKQPSRFPDQDVLNLTGGAHRIPMSLAWNFPIFMLNSRVKQQIAPRIYHFMSNPKPWHGVFPPWKSDARRPYLDMVGRYPELAAYHSTMPLMRQFRYHLQQRYKRSLETFTWGLSVKRTRILDYERKVAAIWSETR